MRTVATILIVDDSLIVRKNLLSTLQNAGYHTLEAKDGVEALEVLKGHPEIQLVALDVEMPRMDGFETLEAMHQAGFKQPVIFVTANDLLKDRYRGFRLGATSFINKSKVKDELLPLVERLLNPGDRLKKIKILVASSEEANRSVLSQAMEQEGAEVLQCLDGVSAYRTLENEGENLDLIICTLTLDNIDGVSLCKAVRQYFGLNHLPFIMLLNEAESQRTLEVFAAGGTDYLQMPYAMEELLARIYVHLEVRILNRHLRTNLVEMQKLNEMKDRFLSICSHDLRSPVHSIMGNASLLKDELTTPDHLSILDDIDHSGEFLLGMIDDLLELGRSQKQMNQVKMEILSLHKIFDQVIKIQQSVALQKNLTIDRRIDGPDLHVVGDQKALTRILHNLISNAIKFSSPGRQIKLQANLRGDHCKIQVIDQGRGMTPEQLSHLFDEFTEAHSRGTHGEKGTGLGMSIVKRLTEAQNGTIDVHSILGKGTTFTLTLFSADQPFCLLKDKDQSPFNQGINVLIAEDNPINRKLLLKLLAKKQCQCTVCETGYEAIETYKSALEKNDPFDIILMDTQMPELDGIAATKAIRQLENGQKHTPILSMSANQSQEEIALCKAAGMDDTLPKPLALQTLEHVMTVNLKMRKTP